MVFDLESEQLTVEYINPKNLKVFDYSRKLFPELKGEAYEFLKADIKENGIRTPLEVTKEGLILCGHERHRIAIELGLKEIPVIYFPNVEDADQKIRCIKDNLARKAVDVRTKVRCYGELRELYGIKQRQNPKDAFGHYRKVSDSVPSGGATEIMSHADMAKEVGMSGSTLERSLKIENSDLPEEIKDAAFKGKIGIEPVANLLKEPEPIQKEVIPKVLEEISQNKEHIFVQDIVSEVKDKDCGFSEANHTMRDFLTQYTNTLEKMPTVDTTQEDLKLAVDFFKKLLKAKGVTCPICGERHLQWRCGHAF